MKLLTLLLLCGCAEARPTKPVIPQNMRYAPYAEVTFNPLGREVYRTEWRLIDGGRRAESVVIYNDGSRKRFVFTLPPLRTTK